MNLIAQIESLQVSITSQDALIGRVSHLTITYPANMKGLYFGKQKVRALVTLAIMGKVRPCRELDIRLSAIAPNGAEALIYKQSVSSRN